MMILQVQPVLRWGKARDEEPLANRNFWNRTYYKESTDIYSYL